ncbi:hypothetical protein EDB19DRAFT_1948111 [Suillus lakei]|nr:hypothetical protein EDB19DRAFT_1948111 [Suillus lakei]
MWEGEAGETRLAQVGDLKEDPWIVGVNEVPFGGREGLSLTIAIPGTFATDLEDAMSEVRGRIYQALVAYGFRVAHSGDQECDVELPRAPWVTRKVVLVSISRWEWFDGRCLSKLFLLKTVDPQYKDDICRFILDTYSCRTKAGLHDPFLANTEVNSHNLAVAFEI